ncbi:MAG: tyrosine-type recombinase/integrase [Acidobacteria bacterium]|nr:tyrosine-type recombinase/integrase [Acidobacteriota bacterium]
MAAPPLAEEGVQAARDFVAQGAFGSWSCPRANKALVRAARHAQRPAFTVYAIRHSFAAGLRRTGTDVADIQDLHGHTNPRTTVIYAPPQLVKHQAAIARFLRALESGGRGNGWQYLDGRCKLLILNARP